MSITVCQLIEYCTKKYDEADICGIFTSMSPHWREIWFGDFVLPLMDDIVDMKHVHQAKHTHTRILVCNSVGCKYEKYFCEGVEFTWSCKDETFCSQSIWSWFLPICDEE